LKIGVDVGGTFTDLYELDERGDRRNIAKVPSTPDDFTLGVLAALADANIEIDRIDLFIHGSTIITNAAIEKTYPETPFITTAGFRDFTLIGRYHRESLYDPFQIQRSPLVKRRHIFEIPERISAAGKIDLPLDLEAAGAVAEKIKRQGAGSVAVGFLNSYINPEHELRMKDILQQEIPQIFVSLSSDIPKIRALGRFSTAILRGCLNRVAKGYLDRLKARLDQKKFSGRLLIVSNNGGMIDADLAARKPELMLTSGPASGVNAALFMSRRLGIGKLITMDMGGTSCDVSIIENGQPLVTSEYEIQWDTPLSIPMLDIRTIGAGGGSIAWIDTGGSIRVGPRSAGSLPGPACYGRGGRSPTVTDANVVLGRIGNRRVFGKEIHIDAARSETAISGIAAQIRLDLIETASGIITIVNENMAASLKQISLDRGRDPRDFSLVAFGGAGALHAVFLAKTLGIKRVLFPCHEGVFSAYGAVVMDFKNDHEKTFYCPVAAVDLSELNRQYRELDQKGFDIMQRQGVAGQNVHLARSAQIRYIGQTYEVETPVPAGEIDSAALEKTLLGFHQEHAREYGFAEQSFPAAFVNLRSTVIGKIDKPQLTGIQDIDVYDGSEAIESRQGFFDEHGFVKTLVYDRQRLPAGFRVDGPAILEDASATAIIAPEMSGEVDDYGYILVTL